MGYISKLGSTASIVISKTTKMKFAIALTTLLAGAVTGGQLDSRFARLLNKYNTLGPELLKILPKETTSGLSLDDSLGALEGFGTSIASYQDINFDSLKAAGYTELAEDMEIAAGLGLVAGEIGLEAEVQKQNYQAAKILGDAAGAKGMEALAALPPTTAVDPKEIDDLKSQNEHNLADSLANVKRLLDSTNFFEFMLTALQPLQQAFSSKPDAATQETAQANVVQQRISSSNPRNLLQVQPLSNNYRAQRPTGYQIRYY